MSKLTLKHCTDIAADARSYASMCGTAVHYETVVCDRVNDLLEQAGSALRVSGLDATDLRSSYALGRMLHHSQGQ